MQIRDHNSERGYVHPDLRGQHEIGFRDEDGRFVPLWSESYRDGKRFVFAEGEVSIQTVFASWFLN